MAEFRASRVASLACSARFCFRSTKLFVERMRSHTGWCSASENASWTARYMSSSSPNVASTCLSLATLDWPRQFDQETLEHVVSELQLTVPLHCAVAPAGGNLGPHPWLDQNPSLCPSSLREPDGRRLTRCVENEATALTVGVDLATTVATTLGRDPRRNPTCDVESPETTKIQFHKTSAKKT